MTEKITNLSRTLEFNEYVSLAKFMKREGLAFKGDIEYVLKTHVLQIHQATENTTYYVRGKSRNDFVFRPALLKSITQLLYRTDSAYERFVDEYTDFDSTLFERVVGALRYPFDEWAYVFGNHVARTRSHLKRKEKALAKAKELAASIGLPTYSRMELNSVTGAIRSVPEYPCWLLDSLELSF